MSNVRQIMSHLLKDKLKIPLKLTIKTGQSHLNQWTWILHMQNLYTLTAWTSCGKGTFHFWYQKPVWLLFPTVVNTRSSEWIFRHWESPQNWVVQNSTRYLERHSGWIQFKSVIIYWAETTATPYNNYMSHVSVLQRHSDGDIFLDAWLTASFSLTNQDKPVELVSLQCAQMPHTAVQRLCDNVDGGENITQLLSSADFTDGMEVPLMYFYKSTYPALSPTRLSLFSLKQM